MLRRFADTLLEELLAAFPAGNPYDENSFRRAPMPAPIAHYLAQALSARLEVESARVRPTASPWFNLDAEEVRNAARTFAEVIVRHGQFPAEEWPAALERAVRNVVAYQARPARTLIDFLFPKELDTYTRDGLSKKLAYFMPYPHLDESLESLHDGGEADEITQDEVASLLEQVDAAMSRTHDVSSWLKWLEPLHDMASVIEGYEGSIPVDLYIAFFRDKNVERVERRLERMHEQGGVDLMSIDELREVLDDVKEVVRRPPVGVRHERVVIPERRPADAVEAASEMPSSRPAPGGPPAEAPSRGSESQGPPPRLEEPAGRPAAQPERTIETGTPSPVPIWKQFQQQPAPPRVERPSAPAAAPVSGVSGPSREPAEPRPLWMRFAGGPGADEEARTRASTGSERRQEPPLEQLEQIVLGKPSSQNRAMYVAELFDHSEDAYRSALQRLKDSRSWQEASRIIANDVFRPRGVDIYSDPAVSFTDAVEARFQARS